MVYVNQSYSGTDSDQINEEHKRMDKVCITEDNLFITCKGFNGGSYMFHTNQGKWWLQKKSTNDEINDLRFAEGCISHTM